jgi:PAS domain S-box-containing protein
MVDPISPHGNDRMDERLLFRAMLEQTGDGIFVFDATGRTILVNPAFHRMTGYSRSDLENVDCRNIFPDDIFTDSAAAAPLPAFFAFSRKNGSRFSAELRVFPLAFEGKDIFLGVLRDVTEHKQIESNLLREKERAQGYLDIAGVMIVAIDARGKVNLINRKGAEMLGYTREEIVGKNWFDHFIPADTRENVRTFFNDLLNEKVSLEENPVNPVQTKTGDKRMIAWHNTLLRDDSENVTGTLSSGLDITRQTEAEQALKQSESKFRSITEHATDFIFVKNHERRYTFVNRAMQSLLDLSEDRIVGKTPEELFGPDQGKLIREIDDRVFSGETVNETRSMVVQGRSIYFNTVQIPLTVEDGTVTSILGIVRDVTEQKRAEEALRDSEHQKELILNATSEIVIYFDTDLCVLWANHASAGLVGKSPEDLVGMHCHEIWHRRSTPCPDCPVRESFQDRQPRQCEVLSPDGRRFLLRSYPVLDRAGEVAALVEFGLDITARVRAEKEKKRLKEQFHQIQKLESIGRLAGGVAHDLNNLLSPILGYGELLLARQDADGPNTRPLGEIVSSARRARDLVRQLLAFSRKQALKFTAVDLNVLLREFKSCLRSMIREDIAIHMECDPACPAVRGDGGQLEQVIMNLAANAQDAMPDGGELVLKTASFVYERNDSKTKSDKAKRNCARLTISDSGQGIDETTRENIFEPFFTTKEKGKGTGLGLATVYGIVKQHGGEITVLSEPGCGTTFMIDIPAAGLPADESALPGLSVAPRSRGGETVLLVEDSPGVRKLAFAVLQSQGYRVLEASSGQEAIEIVKSLETPLHLVLTDVVMPEMNGRQMFERIASYSPQTRVLFMSGYPDDVIAHRGIVDPGIHFIQKPFTNRELAAKIREVLDR